LATSKAIACSVVDRNEICVLFVEDNVVQEWEDNIKMDLREVGGDGDWMELAQDMDRWQALVNTVMNFRVP